MNTVEVKRGYRSKDFTQGQYVCEIPVLNHAEMAGGSPEELVYCVEEARSDGTLRVIEIKPPFKTRTLRAEDCEPFYGTIILESKP